MKYILLILKKIEVNIQDSKDIFKIWKMFYILVQVLSINYTKKDNRFFVKYSRT